MPSIEFSQIRCLIYWAGTNGIYSFLQLPSLSSQHKININKYSDKNKSQFAGNNFLTAKGLSWYFVVMKRPIGWQ